MAKRGFALAFPDRRVIDVELGRRLYFVIFVMKAVLLVMINQVVMEGHITGLTSDHHVVHAMMLKALLVNIRTCNISRLMQATGSNLLDCCTGPVFVVAMQAHWVERQQLFSSLGHQSHVLTHSAQSVLPV